MDYEKAYKEALERAKNLLATSVAYDRFTIERIFPELKESEDERIRKELIFYLGDMPEDTELRNGVTNRDVLAWLEKQESVGEIVERCKNSWYNEGKIAGMAEGLTDDEKYQQGWHDALEKQGEKKATDKVEPTLEEKVNILADKIIDLRLIVKALEIQAIRQCSDKNRLDSLESKMIILDSYNINNRLDALESSVFEEGK